MYAPSIGSAVEAPADGSGVRLRLGSRNPQHRPVLVEASSEAELPAVGERVEVVA